MDEMNLSELFDEMSNIITLTDEDGNDTDFELLDLIEYNDETYAILLPTEDEDDSEVVILKVEADNTDDEMVSYLPVESEEDLAAVFEIFKENFKDEFNFVD